jgi:translation initiation factor 3 subunit I
MIIKPPHLFHLLHIRPHHQMSPDGSYVITASLDKTAKLIDLLTLEPLKTYKTGRFVQSAAISPLYDHVLLGGGQDASQVGGVLQRGFGFRA